VSKRGRRRGRFDKNKIFPPYPLSSWYRGIQIKTHIIIAMLLKETKRRA
jgi:hypothetical protein